MNKTLYMTYLKKSPPLLFDLFVTSGAVNLFRSLVTAVIMEIYSERESYYLDIDINSVIFLSLFRIPNPTPKFKKPY